MEEKTVTTGFLWGTCKELIRVINNATKIDPSKNQDPTVAYTEITDRLKELQPVQDKLVEMFDIVLAKIRSHLVLGRDQFFGLELLQMNLMTDLKLSPKSGEAPITTILDRLPMEIRVNPLFLEGYTAAHIESMLVAELLSLSFSYPIKFNKINRENDPNKHKALNRAGSAACTEMVKRYITIDREAKRPGMKISDKAYTVEDLRTDTAINAIENKTLEYYYSIYRNGMQDGESDSGDQRDEQDVVITTNLDPNLPSTPNFRSNNVKNSVHNWESQYTPNETEARIKSIISKAYNEFQKSSQRGTIPQALKSEIDIMLAPPKLDWRKVVENLAGALLVPFRRSPARPNKKYPERTDISGRLPKHKIEIICVLDVSGSMNDKDYEYCINEVFGASKANETVVTVIECDAKVQSVYTIDSQKKRKRIERSAYGGTEFTPAIEYINQHNYRDTLCIYFTDGFGESSIPKPRVQKMMWVVLDSADNLSVQNPYGVVCALKDDEKYRAMKGI